ncbi:hypothetical protein SSABA_v1c03070 [Spiroplasma sabaudiense Ar-1343]|uniref:Uncharacterized protein n=1 Tax=Spiroplasma sabaudiense Ar-1343 TaxID=1276257 RepID=W6AJ39_9MOLU|nr:hypothetical protein [Spiroplasma sabaudiense]AHI53719.1 hypothetical protein SSABA_v1c03070 [Spiroplasma sabaudiense Ar-1343]
MKDIFQIRSDLEKNGWLWPPNYKDIEVKIWPNIETYFDAEETVLSALWASFDRFETPMVGMVFITDKRIFTIEINDDAKSDNVRYVPIDSYRIDKIEYKKAKSDDDLNEINLLNDTFGSGVKFKTPNRKVAQHFLNTLGGVSDVEIVEVDEVKKTVEPKTTSQIKKPEVAKLTEKVINFEKPQPKIKQKPAPRTKPTIEETKPFEKSKVKTQKTQKTLKTPTKKLNAKFWWFTIPVAVLILTLLLIFTF